MLATDAWANSLSDAVVLLFKDVCVSPAGSEERMAAAERRAKDEHWTLLKSQPAPRPFMHNEYGTIDSWGTIWELNLQEGSRARLSISILRPEPPGQRHTVCMVSPSIDSDASDLADSVDRQFGSTLARDDSGRFKGEKRWFFTEEKARGNCGKTASFCLNQFSDRGKPKALLFMDFAYPSDEPIAELAQCPKR
jgi:hypothetical protein